MVTQRAVETIQSTKRLSFGSSCFTIVLKQTKDNKTDCPASVIKRDWLELRKYIL